MTAAATFAHTHQLRPGIALSAAQVAQLTSDIVWLVAQTVQLPDGSSTTALVPRIYLAPRPGDLAPDGQLFGSSMGGAAHAGSLIGARDIQLSLSGDLHNSATIAGRRLVDLSAQNMAHSGLIQADVALLSAQQDIRIQGGQVAAHSGLALQAGGNIGIESTTQSANTQAGANTFSRQGMDRIAGLYVSGPAGALLARAGGDIELIAAQLHNAGSGSTQLQAAGDIRLGTARTEQSHDLTWSANNYHRQSRSQEVGSQVSGGGTVTLQAGHELHARAAQINAQGALTVHAAGNLTLEAGHSSQSLAEAQQSTNRGFLSTTTITTRSSSQSSTAQGSELTGQSVSVLGHNVLSIGTRFEAQGGLLHIEGANQTLLYATQDSQRRETHTQTQRSTLGITTGQSETTHTTQSNTAVRTELLSDQAVRIGVGERTELVGARVQAPEIDFVRSQNAAANAAPDAAGQLHLGAAVEHSSQRTQSNRTTLGLWQQTQDVGYAHSRAQMSELSGSVTFDPSIRLSVELPREVHARHAYQPAPSLQAQVGMCRAYGNSRNISNVGRILTFSVKKKSKAQN